MLPSKILMVFLDCSRNPGQTGAEYALGFLFYHGQFFHSFVNGLFQLVWEAYHQLYLVINSPFA